MLVLNRKEQERVILTLPNGEEITVLVKKIRQSLVELAFAAPNDVQILRQELIRKKSPLSKMIRAERKALSSACSTCGGWHLNGGMARHADGHEGCICRRPQWVHSFENGAVYIVVQAAFDCFDLYKADTLHDSKGILQETLVWIDAHESYNAATLQMDMLEEPDVSI